MPNIYTDWKKEALFANQQVVHTKNNNNIAFIVQQYDEADETTDGEMPDLDTFDWEEMDGDTWDDHDQSYRPGPGPGTNTDKRWNPPQSNIIYNKSATFPRQTNKCEEVTQVNAAPPFVTGKLMQS